MSILRRLPALAPALAVLALPVAAHAAVTASSVDQPTDPTQLTMDLRNGAPEPKLTISGHATAGVGDKVDVICQKATYDANMALNVPVNAGTFTVQVNRADLPAGPCHMRALPHGTPYPAARGPFTGPSWRQDAYEESRTKATDKTPNVFYDFYLAASGRSGSGFMDFDSVGSCGLDDSWVADPAKPVETGNYFFYCNGYLPGRNTFDDATATRSDLKVDGHNAYLPASVPYPLRPKVAGLPPVTWQASIDPLTGAAHIEETDPVVACPGDPYPATLANCPTLQVLPVVYKRTTDSSADNRTARQVDRLTATDGAQHTASLLFENDFYIYNGVDGVPAFQVPWAGGAFTTKVDGDQAPAPAAGVTSVFIQGLHGAPDGDGHPLGAITWSSAPDGLRWIAQKNESHAATFLADFERTIPAGGELSLTTYYSDALKLADAQAAAKAAQDTLNPPPPAPLPPAPTPPAPVVPQSQPPASCTVPKLLGHTTKKAAALLRAAHCKLGKAKHAYVAPRHGHRATKHDRIVRQAAKAGAVLPAGTKVDVTLQGRKPARHHHRRRAGGR